MRTYCFPLLSLLLLLLLTAPLATQAARVDTLDVPSATMQRSYRAAVVLPDSYAKAKKSRYPVLYLLHGAYGRFSDWLRKTPDPLLVQRLADQYQLLIVLPEGANFGWYLDSPVNPASQFETYLTKEVIGQIDATYRTVARREGRAIAGLSMGGHGALYLAARHPELFAAAGSMSGALDLSGANRLLNPDEARQRQSLFNPLLGPETEFPERYAANSVLHLLDQLGRANVALILDCGVDDFLIDINREVHRRLVYQRIPHDYTERPGAHTWPYWQTALPYQVQFLRRALAPGP